MTTRDAAYAAGWDRTSEEEETRRAACDFERAAVRMGDQAACRALRGLLGGRFPDRTAATAWFSGPMDAVAAATDDACTAASMGVVEGGGS